MNQDQSPWRYAVNTGLIGALTAVMLALLTACAPPPDPCPSDDGIGGTCAGQSVGRSDKDTISWPAG